VKTTVDISFVILSWNSDRFLEGCLNSLKTDLAGSGFGYEAILIDNGSNDGSTETLKRFAAEGHPLVVIPLGCNTGTTFSRNIGLRMAQGRYICVLDSDILFCEPDTLVRLIALLETAPTAGILSPGLKYASGNHQKSYDVFPTIANKVKRLFFLRQMEVAEGRRALPAKDLVEVDYTISAFWLFRRDLMDAIGLLDEKIFYAPEDVDFCLRSWLGGFPVLFSDRVKVVHLAQEISRKKPFSRAAWRHLKGLAYFFRKHGYWVNADSVHQRIRTAVAARSLEPAFGSARKKQVAAVAHGALAPTASTQP
jgi:GT2 family glycosyltransferase